MLRTRLGCDQSGPAGRTRERTARGMRCLRCLGARRGRRQAELLRPLRPAAPRPGSRGHRRRRRQPGGRVQGPRTRQPGLRRADPGCDERACGDRPLPVLHHRLDDLGELAADLPHHRRRDRRGPGPQRQPGQHRGPRGACARAGDQEFDSDVGLRCRRCAPRARRRGQLDRAGRDGTAAHPQGRVLPDLHG